MAQISAVNPANAGQALADIKVLPLGWSTFTPLSIFGWIVTASVLFGAPFWFDLLQRLVNLRGTGPRPEQTAPDEQRPSPRLMKARVAHDGAQLASDPGRRWASAPTGLPGVTGQDPKSVLNQRPRWLVRGNSSGSNFARAVACAGVRGVLRTVIERGLHICGARRCRGTIPSMSHSASSAV